MATTGPVVELDFDILKSELINFFKQNPTFTDYNFDGSALNAVVDILAYNTHYNGVYANMVHNESFLDTAQKRSSVVSHAKELGYVPDSVSGSRAVIDIKLNNVPIGTGPFLIQRGVTFRSSNDNDTYNFIVANDTSVTIEGNDYSFKDVVLKEGKLLTNFFTVDNITNPRNIFTIPNKNIDVTTLKVFVKDNLTSVTRREYLNYEDSYSLTADSYAFFVQESYDGTFQIYFGDDVLGKKLSTGNVIEISYIVSSAKDFANGCTVFEISGSIGPAQSINVITKQISFGGSDVESIDSIKFNAPKFYQSNGRAVTANDYSTLLKNKFPFIKAVNVFGGQDLNPPVYGKVFICIQPYENFILSDIVKQSIILPEIQKNCVITILHEFIDPEYFYITVDASVKFNRNKTTSTQEFVKNELTTKIIDYFNSELNTFDKDYIKSELIGSLVDLDPGISGIEIKNKLSTRIYPTVTTNEFFSINFGNVLTKGSLISTLFKTKVNSVERVVYIKDDSTNLTIEYDRLNNARFFGQLNLYSADDNTFIKNVGKVEYSSINQDNSGSIELTLNVSNFVDAQSPYIILYTSTESEDIITKRNRIVTLDDTVSSGIINSINGIQIGFVSYER